MTHCVVSAAFTESNMRAKCDVNVFTHLAWWHGSCTGAAASLAWGQGERPALTTQEPAMDNAVAVNQPYDVAARLAEIKAANETKALQDKINALEAENARLQNLAVNKAGTLTIRASKHGTGTLCVYGLSRQYPVSLYKNQWRKLAAIMPQILAELDANPRLYPDKG